jgi:ubiquinone/menaquinone biosynthesis C-methylase UbiE
MYLRLRAPRLERAVPIRSADGTTPTETQAYWTDYTVNSIPFGSARRSLDYLDWRFRQYPMFRELMRLYGDHDDEVVLDYGCGPGNDLVGHLVYSNARKIIGVDVSFTALRLASHRLGLHREHGLHRVELVHTSERVAAIPLADASVDHIYCEGVLMHTSDPAAVLRELARVLRPGGTAAVMVYSADSVRKHLVVAYQTQILEGRYRELSLDDAFQKCTDGEDCPIARNFAPAEFEAMCRAAGFARASYEGGYLSVTELRCLERYGEQARADTRLGAESRAFLDALEPDHRGYPRYRGKYAGSGGVYWLTR